MPAPRKPLRPQNGYGQRHGGRRSDEFRVNQGELYAEAGNAGAPLAAACLHAADTPADPACPAVWKKLEEANAKRHSVITDITGRGGQTDDRGDDQRRQKSVELVEVTDYHIKATYKELYDALHGRLTDHHRSSSVRVVDSIWGHTIPWRTRFKRSISRSMRRSLAQDVDGAVRLAASAATVCFLDDSNRPETAVQCRMKRP
jgi:hypothetical protein